MNPPQPLQPSPCPYLTCLIRWDLQLNRDLQPFLLLPLSFRHAQLDAPPLPAASLPLPASASLPQLVVQLEPYPPAPVPCPPQFRATNSPQIAQTPFPLPLDFASSSPSSDH